MLDAIRIIETRMIVDTILLVYIIICLSISCIYDIFAVFKQLYSETSIVLYFLIEQAIKLVVPYKEELQEVFELARDIILLISALVVTKDILDRNKKKPFLHVFLNQL